MPPLSPIRCEISVPADPQRAFAVFTEEIVAWWPIQQMNVLGAASLVSFEDDRLVEATVDGSEAVWARVRVWEPGRRLSLRWSPGTDAISEVTISFSAADDGTDVALEHSGWGSDAAAAAEHADYAQGWPRVLEHYRAQFPPPSEPADIEPADTWVALLHTPGPEAPRDRPLFADPRFGEHTAFLQRMSDRGYLVAAGPFAAADGSGMTILRLPGPDRLAEAAGLATLEDGAVASGLLAVSVRPWSVTFHSLD